VNKFNAKLLPLPNKPGRDSKALDKMVTIMDESESEEQAKTYVCPSCKAEMNIKPSMLKHFNYSCIKCQGPHIKDFVIKKEIKPKGKKDSEKIAASKDEIISDAIAHFLGYANWTKDEIAGRAKLHSSSDKEVFVLDGVPLVEFYPSTKTELPEKNKGNGYTNECSTLFKKLY